MSSANGPASLPARSHRDGTTSSKRRSSSSSSSRRRTRTTIGGGRGGEPSQRLRVVLLGDMRVGKTSILQRFVQGTFNPRVSRTTFMEEMEKEVMVDNQRYVLHLVDTCGGERFKTLRENFYRGTQVCLLTFALDSLASFCNLTMWREEFLYYSDVPVGCEFPFLVLGNKVDLPERAISDLNVQAWCRANGDVPYFEMSAKAALNVDEVFEAAVRRFREVASQNHPWGPGRRHQGEVVGELVDLSGEKGSKSAGCCG